MLVGCQISHFGFYLSNMNVRYCSGVSSGGVTLDISEQSGIMILTINYETPVSTGDIDLIYPEIISALFTHAYPAIDGYAKMTVAYQSYDEDEDKSFTYTLGVAIGLSDSNGNIRHSTIANELLALLQRRVGS